MLDWRIRSHRAPRTEPTDSIAEPPGPGLAHYCGALSARNLSTLIARRATQQEQLPSSHRNEVAPSGGSTKEAWIPAALSNENALDCCRNGRIPI